MTEHAAKPNIETSLATEERPSLFDEMLKNEEYRKLFDSLPDDEKPIIMQSVRQFVNDVEKSVNTISEMARGRT